MKLKDFSWLGFFNYYLFQWFFVRLAKGFDENTGKFVKWVWLKGVYPLTGWNSNYRFIGKK